MLVELSMVEQRHEAMRATAAASRSRGRGSKGGGS